MKTRTRLQAALVGVGVALPTLLSTTPTSAAVVTPEEPAPRVVPPTKAPTPETPNCVATLLTGAQMRAHQSSVVTCYATQVEADAAMGHVASLADGPMTNATTDTLKATFWDVAGGSGTDYKLDVPLVNGGCGNYLSFAAGDWWNDRISSTSHKFCGTVKHYDNNDLTGAKCFTNSTDNRQFNLADPAVCGDQWLSDRVSSIWFGN